MRYTIPDYYKEFCCTADKCEDTCCAGWQIVIDRKSLIKYGKVKGDFRKRLYRSIRWLEGTFKQSEDRRCAFLNEENLCDMYTNLGEDALCRTCRLYPRHVEEFEGVREISLSLSCPEAAKLLLSKEEPVRFLSYEKEGAEEYEDFDLLLYSRLADAREVMMKILQDRNKNIDVRVGLVLAIAHDMQVRIQKGQLFSCDEVFDKYQWERAKRFLQEKVGEWKADAGRRYEFARKTFSCLYKLEILKEDWVVSLKETEMFLYGAGEVSYEKICGEFDKWQRENLPLWEVQCEQLLVYFVFTYFCGAVYDGRVYAKVQMAAASLFFINQILMGRWVKNDGMLDMEDIISTVYRYSREIEHSDANLERVEKMMEGDVWLCGKKQ